MAAQFCMSCGKPLPADAKFCSACATPVGTGTSAANPAPAAVASSTAPPPVVAPLTPASVAPPAPAGPPAPAAPPLAETLGLQGCRSFILEHQLLSGGRSYRVLDHEKRHLFTVKENLAQELMANAFRGRTAPQNGLHFGRVEAPARTALWTVADRAGTPQGAITIQFAGNVASSTLSDSAGAAVLGVSVERSMMGGLTATAAFPDGRAMLRTHGNLLRHNFQIQDAAGREVAKVHEGFVSIRDAYHLDLVGDVDPLSPLVFAILIDREKAAQ